MPFDKARTAVQGNASPLIPVHAAESHSHRDGSATAAAQSDAQGQVPVQSRYNPVESAKAKHVRPRLSARDLLSMEGGLMSCLLVIVMLATADSS